MTSFGQLQLYYLSHQLSQYSKSTVAYVLLPYELSILTGRWIGSCQSTLTFLGSVLAGRYFDAHGSRTLVLLGTLFSVSALIALAFCQEYYQFLLAHMLYGISGSLVYSPATAISGHWFLRRRSTAVGIIVCGSGLGGVIYPVMLKSLFDRQCEYFASALDLTHSFPQHPPHCRCLQPGADDSGLLLHEVSTST